MSLSSRIFALLLIVAIAGNTRPSHARVSTADPREAVAVFREARLRKLHLVRPDLINYPISFDVVC